MPNIRLIPLHRRRYAGAWISHTQCAKCFIGLSPSLFCRLSEVSPRITMSHDERQRGTRSVKNLDYKNASSAGRWQIVELFSTCKLHVFSWERNGEREHAQGRAFGSAALRERLVLKEGFSSGRIAREDAALSVLLGHMRAMGFPVSFPDREAITEFVRALQISRSHR